MKRLLPFILLLLSPLNALPFKTVDMYLGEAPVADQSKTERERALPLALVQVAQKLSGLASLDGYPELEVAIQSASSMVLSFHYRSQKLKLPDGSEFEELRLVARFSPEPVNRFMHELQLPLWQRERRPLNIWLVVDDGVSRRIMPIELEYAWGAMTEVAETRGMPVNLPQRSADGEYTVDPQLLWGGYTEELTTSGPADALVIAARREGPEWSIRMNLDYAGRQSTWRIRGAELRDELVVGMHRAIDEIASVDSIAATDQAESSFRLTVTGIAGSADYVRCLNYLQRLSLVERVVIISAAPGRVQFELRLNALPDYLRRSLATDGVLVLSNAASEYLLQQ